MEVSTDSIFIKLNTSTFYYLLPSISIFILYTG